MTKLIIQTQVLENYGAHDWDGEGRCPQYWKAKGSDEYVVLNVDACDMIEVIVDRARSQIEISDDYYREFIIGWSVEDDDYLTDFERSQLEYEGKIAFPARVIEV